MSQVSITDCTFTSNFALDGHGIYIEGDDPGTVFTIKDNTFTDNYDKSSQNNYNAIILTEIYSIYNSNINTTNIFNNEKATKSGEYSDKSRSHVGAYAAQSIRT